ncbi:uncharacterized protein LOC106159891 [Lingula anatina]|uniref:Uncharacterized protein LOC106159891 n=1 Tax=Lingula anatina TaxID=7574 RepID=A0A1S3I363_LINAN|nr:uncharacterized protein LOC106159891 [Lingula anatina]XP_013391788.1 uncharacterized protein LOC106159891 [Lingula anatina]XP_013391789.1 uncharacterized protein LOC106159891 [Lingula anatina]XP_013391790.1 uncharacterized protein LOC106159891 [Lingula anatina]|eukprot:XP_013391787.1 uncharacterized protein LOC106159891 [Lingula anatina]
MRVGRTGVSKIRTMGLLAFVTALVYLTLNWENSLPSMENILPKTKLSRGDLNWSFEAIMEFPRKYTCDRWIVVDTGKRATAQHIKQVADRLHTPWCAVVVSDTLPSSDTLALQQEDRHHLHVVLPNKQNGIIYLNGATKYSALLKSDVRRKTIGYLFAITSGATMIYDDDGGIEYEWLTSGPPLHDKNVELPLVIPAGQVNFWNPLAYFYSRSDIWPRGFPGNMSRRPACSAPPLPTALRNSSVLLSHFLTGGYADETEGTLKSPLKFNKAIRGPVEVQKGTFVPYGQHSTLHMYDAFWGLLVPTTCEESISDIIRGYITQRLLWDINGSMSVSPPWTKRRTSSNRRTRKSSHNYDKTLIEVVNHLETWSSKSTSIDARLKELYLHLFEKGIILKEDLLILDTWLELLTAAGYVFPRTHVPGWAERRAMAKPWDSVRLCVHFNNVPNKQAFTTLYQMYSRHFKEISFTGDGARQPFMDPSVHFLPCTKEEQDGGRFLHRCLLKHLTYSGFGNNRTPFLFVSDDTFFNLSSFLSYRRDVLWILGPIGTSDIDVTWPDSWYWWPFPYGGAALRKILDILPGEWRDHLALMKNWTQSGKRLVSVYNADTVFIPNNRYQTRFIEVLKWLTGANIPSLFAEIASPLLVDLTTEKLDRSDVISLKSNYPHTGLETALKARSCNLLHPLKLSKDRDRLIWLSMFKSVETIL